MILNDAREYIVPLLSVPAEGNGVRSEGKVFLGTAFLVSKRGDAITAGHVLPAPGGLKEGHKLIAVVYVNGRQQLCWVTHAAKFEAFDVALVHLNLDNTKFLPIAARDVTAGTDVEIIGIPDHEVRSAGKEMRILKGHVTLAAGSLELNFPVPKGMSGSPVFAGGVAIGWAAGTVRSEELDESVEEETEVRDGHTITRRTEIRRVVHYGIAHSFSAIRKVKDPVLGGLALPDFIRSRNEA